MVMSLLTIREGLRYISSHAKGKRKKKGRKEEREREKEKKGQSPYVILSGHTKRISKLRLFHFSLLVLNSCVYKYCMLCVDGSTHVWIHKHVGACVYGGQKQSQWHVLRCRAAFYVFETVSVTGLELAE